MNDLVVCPFEEKYIDSILSIEELSFKDPWSKDAMERELNNNFARYVVVKQQNKVIGYGGMWIILDEGHITNIAVDPKYRCIGVGKLILKSLIDICKGENVTSLTLEVRVSNIIAQNLYSKFGFISEGIRKNYYADNNEDALIMWKRNIK
ncbi:putative ribosomal-protein-alanine acetyltransferase [Clostridium pasteurianum DSM 525 = ATCC 6013]|uniref:[Ribosomal protein bS18]-alanine N-acetyltransferase n=1 Tax=Clostridium pasteurianum DSM 525 = ATCC 6013 TaxID=1262449 RepID=A0A0H3JBE1_CLOPA|nr:ribosomal protein S18-alanine N-acetyltransferase [Clostridium pasteurianum]AJA49570.1 putative ribosomal-protein-alanine acetyltransferase [Clostridium pasteurianum DSM 525 = ATCC 6013]AJA53558.1 putative ribosomal-protein-alanine acetyltransferase [Clostridium pasteurianum DSM 525 = ATCC 6013]AOZ76724.1 ribosomal-protein-alanine acetyltransferase [Clostridium pasteurianum DSM 525 = ATCC 6013]AOZ80521.1 ribosomal-protein-alanine acetyltransferase [Clostridium pasteurianum]ELP58914.1 acetyl